MAVWKKPNVTIVDKTTMQNAIKAKAMTIGSAMTMGQLCDQGIGASGYVYVNTDYVECRILDHNPLLGLFLISVAGILYWYDPETDSFT